MATEFDEKGKIFTNVITKKPIPVVVQTTAQRIQGKLHITPTDRIMDVLNSSDQYLAMTDVIIYDERGEILYKSKFLSLNRDLIIWLIPADEIQD